MQPLTHEDAYNATDPSLSDDERKASANRILEGVRANQIYWDSRPELEALRAQAEGHGIIVRGADDEGTDPTAVGTGTGGESPAIEATATEEGTTVLKPGESASNVVAPVSGVTAPAPSPDNPTEAVARLRSQLQANGITPEA